MKLLSRMANISHYCCSCIHTVVWKNFGVKKISYCSLVMKLKHTNIIPLQNFSYEIYLNLYLVSTWQARVGYI